MSNITTENLERVEFMRGANSALYGSDAMTGVLQLFTRRGESAPAAGAREVRRGQLFDRPRIGRHLGEDRLG